MERINYLEVEAYNKIKAISVLHGDIMHIEEDIDILFVSIFKGGLMPVPGTLVGTLHDSGINIRKLCSNKAFNFRESLNTWLCAPLDGYSFKRILFFEMRGSPADIKEGAGMKEIFENLFLTLMILEKKGIPVTKIAMPLLGTGNQRLEPAVIIPLYEIENLHEIFLVERNLQKATILSEEIDKYLKRSELRLNTVSFKKNTRESIVKNISKIRGAKFPESKIYNELIDVMKDTASKSYQVGILGRRLLEFILTDLLKQKGLTAYEGICALSKKQCCRMGNKLHASYTNIRQWISTSVRRNKTPRFAC